MNGDCPGPARLAFLYGFTRLKDLRLFDVTRVFYLQVVPAEFEPLLEGPTILSLPSLSWLYKWVPMDADHRAPR